MGAMKDSSSPVYRQQGQETLIEIRLREVRQLFHTLDPAPFREQDLDEAAERYLVEACREAGARPLRLLVHLPRHEAAAATAGGLPEAVHNYFRYREQQLRLDILRMLRFGLVSFLIGVAFLALCLGLRGWLLSGQPRADRGGIAEGLLILGWVALWRPTEALLYDWWPLLRQRRLMRRLADIPVEVHASAEASPQ
jgi:hypothetical protein